MSLPPLITASDLCAAGRNPVVPFRIVLADGNELTMHQLLRILPGKRIVGKGELGGRNVLAKLFVARDSARHWAQEKSGIEALHRAAVPTPKLIGAAPLSAGGHALLTEFLDSSETLAEAWARQSENPPGNAAALAVLAPALTVLGRMHFQGLVHRDLHLGNFLRHQRELFVIDGDEVCAASPGKPLDQRQAIGNLAILLAQLPASWDSQQVHLLAYYREGGAQLQADPQALQAETSRVRAQRLNRFLAKTVRDCTLFSVHQRTGRFVAAVREQAPILAPLLAAPDVHIDHGALLKDGATCTVAKVGSADRPLTIKRYNLKNFRHALTRLWRPSRAWHSWREGHRLRFLGIPTPAPLALIEERIGPLRRRAWLITEFCSGPNLLDHLSADCEPPPEEASAITSLFRSLHELRISHGDLKATNLLWHEGLVLVIDLDATVQHRSAAEHARAWRRDRARLLRNWPASSVLHRWFDNNLPAV
jgi:tRNA A-37 threonylcarbamoyl transferase component Bud32